MAPQTRPPVSANHGDGTSSTSILYKVYGLIMTPLLFISFVVSLALVDFRYSVLRSHYHAETRPGEHSDTPANNNSQRGSPRWLHRLLFRYRPYQYGAAPTTPDTSEKERPLATATDNDKSAVKNATIHSRWGNYYHSKQRKLMRMETADAFEIRNTVLVFLGVLSLCVVWGVWWVVNWVLYAIGLRG